MNFANLKLRVIGLLEDDDTPAENLYYGTLAALDAILPWFALRSIFDIVGDGTETVFDLPDGVYEIDGVMLSASSEFISPVVIQPGLVRGNVYASNWGDWLEYPHGKLWFSKAPETGETLNVFYRAHWTKPVDELDDSFELLVPAYLHAPISYYAAAYCLTSKAVETANVRQFGTKVDSGNPEHNPIADRVEFLHELFIAEMNRHPRQIAGARA